MLERLGRLGLPVFVKPARAGSSVGITRVTDPADLPAAIEAARAHDPRVDRRGRVPRGPRDRVRRAGRRRRAAGQRVRGDRGPARARLLRLRGQVPRGRRRPDRPRRPARRGRGVGAGAGGAGLRGADLRGPGPRGLLRDPGRSGDRQRGQHDARVHVHLDVPADVAGLGDDLPGARRPPDRRRAAPRHRPAVSQRARAGPGAGPRVLPDSHRRARAGGPHVAGVRRPGAGAGDRGERGAPAPLPALGRPGAADRR